MFGYIGTGIAGAVDLSVQSYDDPTAWQQVGMTPSDGQVQAYSQGSDIASSGALTIRSSESASITATVIAASVAVAGGGDVGVGVSAAGVWTQNMIANDARAADFSQKFRAFLATKILRTEQFLHADDLGAITGGFSNAPLCLRQVFVGIERAGHLDEADTELGSLHIPIV